jgi:hypothetical protein
MADDGYAHITSVDYSEVAVQRLQAVYAPRAALDYAVADVRRMPQYGDGAFGGVLVRVGMAVRRVRGCGDGECACRLVFAVSTRLCMLSRPHARARMQDKGTLDALLCGDAAEGDAARMLGELWRLLSPGAAYVMITSGVCRS